MANNMFEIKYTDFSYAQNDTIKYEIAYDYSFLSPMDYYSGNEINIIY